MSKDTDRIAFRPTPPIELPPEYRARMPLSSFDEVQEHVGFILWGMDRIKERHQALRDEVRGLKAEIAALRDK